MVNLTEEEIQEILNPEDDQTEIESLNFLGLHDCALAAVEQKLQHTQDKSTFSEAIKTALANRRYELAVEYAERLKWIEGVTKDDIQLIGLAYNYAGRPVDAYMMSREAFHRDNVDCTDYYTLACRGSVLGRVSEALYLILKAFSFVPKTDRYLLRKAFLDSELANVWNHAATAIPTLRHALSDYIPDWLDIFGANTDAVPERSVDHSDLKHVPSEFHVLLKTHCASTFETSPLKASQFPDLHRRYLEWQNGIATERAHAFANYSHTCERTLIEAQPLFAEFQAQKNRLTIARYHLICILRNSEDGDPARLPDIPLLTPLLAEFRAQYQESPESFRLLLNRGKYFLLESEFNNLPPINRSSGMAAMYLGNCFKHARRFPDAIRAYRDCAQIWPWDAAPLLNLVFTLQLANRFDEASQVLRLVKDADMPISTRQKIEREIANRHNDHNHCNQRPKVPTPEFAGFFPEADEEFLAWNERRTTSTSQI